MSPIKEPVILAEPPRKLRKPPLQIHSSDNLFSWEQRIEYLKLYGNHSQHFTGLQADMQYFDVPGAGYLAYARHLGRSMVLADPVSAVSRQQEVMTRFLEVHRHATFVQVSEANAEFLHRRFGFYGTQFGSELIVPIQDWTTSGKSRKGIRKAVNQAQKSGITVSESATKLDVEAVSARWLKTRKARSEIRYLVRPADMEYAEGCRYFYAWKDGEPIGFAYFDPKYQDGRVVGYLPNISRGSEEFRQGLFYTIMVHAMDVFRGEGIDHIDLGLSPLALDPDPKPYESGITRKVFELTYKICFHYNCKGIHFTKQRFGGHWSRTYLCHRNALPVVDMWRLLRLTRVL